MKNDSVETNNQDGPAKSDARRRYSFMAMLLMICIPVVLYVAAATETVAIRETLKQAGPPNVADVAMAGGLFMVRIGSMVLWLLSTLVAVFGSPRDSAPKWMVRSNERTDVGGSNGHETAIR